MKTKRFVFLLTLTLCFAVSAFTQANNRTRIIDNAGLLNPAEKTELTAMIDSVSLAFEFDLVIVTEKTIGGKSPSEYADDYYDYNGYGFNESKDGCLFLQVTGSRAYAFSSTGRGIGLLNSYANKRLEDDMLGLLGSEDYIGAYRAYINGWNEFLSLEAKGRSYNFFYKNNFILLIIGWIVSFIIGIIIVLSWKGKMNTALMQTHAAAYIRDGSIKFRVKKDQFLYSTVTRSKRETSSSSGGGGGSRTGSSGTSHGGSSGKY